MKRFLNKLFLFIGVYLVINFLSLILIFKPILYQDYEGVINSNKIRNYHKIILGDSHPAAISQELFSCINAYNMSYPSDSYFDMYIKIIHAKRINPNIDTVYISAGNHTLSDYRERLNNLDRSIFVSNYEDYTKFRDISKFDYVKKKGLKYFPMLQTKNSKLLYAYLKGLFIKKTEKVEWSKIAQDKQEEKSLKRYDEQFANNNKSKMLANTLEKIMCFCLNNDIALIGIKYPVTNYYKELTKHRNFGADTALHNNGFPVLDYSEFNASRKDFFKDQDHLNTKGAIEFIKTLKNKS